MGVPIFKTLDTKPFVYNVTLVLANTEYSLALPVGTHAFSIQPKTNVDVNWAFEAGRVPPAVGQPYNTMKLGAPYKDEDLHADLTLYFSSATAGTIVQATCWI